MHFEADKVCVIAGGLPTTLTLLRSLIYVNLAKNSLKGNVDKFSFDVLSNRDDLNSILRYFSISDNPGITGMENLLGISVAINTCNS